MIRAARAAALLVAFAGATLAGVRADDAPQDAVTHHIVRLAGGRTLAYTATAGMLTLRDEHDAPTANVFFVAYTTGDRARPVTFLSNGGPGSASLWLQLGAFGPRRIAMQSDEPLPAPGAALTDNPATLLDVSDLVFVDPVGTGYSSATGKASDRDFWGVDADIAEFAQFVKRWRSANRRTASKTYLLGESYGTFRSAGLADALEKDGTPVAGVILLSSLLDYADDFGYGDANVPDAFAIPSEAAIAWYHKVLPDPAATLQDTVDAATAFTRDVYLPQIMRPQPLDAQARAALAQQLHAAIGLDPDVIARADLRVSSTQFQSELLRARGAIVGRYDGRVTAPARSGRRGLPDPSFDPLGAVFSAAWTAYAKNELRWQAAGGPYRVLPSNIVNQWNFRRSGFAGRILAPSVIPDLRDALRRDGGMRVFAASGYFDLATPFYTTEYELANAGLDPAAFARITEAFYESGHMIYLTGPALARLHADLDRFYDEATAVRPARRPAASLSSDSRRPAFAGARNVGG